MKCYSWDLSSSHQLSAIHLPLKYLSFWHTCVTTLLCKSDVSLCNVLISGWKKTILNKYTQIKMSEYLVYLPRYTSSTSYLSALCSISAISSVVKLSGRQKQIKILNSVLIFTGHNSNPCILQLNLSIR